jgi:fumarate reductase subunit C
MNTPKKVRPPYIRPMKGWWQRNRFFKVYMARELSSFAVMAYAILLTIGLVALAQGPEQWDRFVQAVRSPLGIALHVVILVSMMVHAKSWFEIMPKTMAPILANGKPVPATTITRSGWAAVLLATLAVMVLAWVLSP